MAVFGNPPGGLCPAAARTLALQPSAADHVGDHRHPTSGHWQKTSVPVCRRNRQAPGGPAGGGFLPAARPLVPRRRNCGDKAAVTGQEALGEDDMANLLEQELLRLASVPIDSSGVAPVTRFLPRLCSLARIWGAFKSANGASCAADTPIQAASAAAECLQSSQSCPRSAKAKTTKSSAEQVGAQCLAELGSGSPAPPSLQRPSWLQPAEPLRCSTRPEVRVDAAAGPPEGVLHQNRRRRIGLRFLAAQLGQQRAGPLPCLDPLALLFAIFHLVQNNLTVSR